MNRENWIYSSLFVGILCTLICRCETFVDFRLTIGYLGAGYLGGTGSAAVHDIGETVTRL